MKIKGYNLREEQANQTTVKRILEANLNLVNRHYYSVYEWRHEITVWQKQGDKYVQAYIITDATFDQYYNIISFIENDLHISEYKPELIEINKNGTYRTDQIQYKGKYYPDGIPEEKHYLGDCICYGLFIIIIIILTFMFLWAI